MMSHHDLAVLPVVYYIRRVGEIISSIPLQEGPQCRVPESEPLP